MNWLKGFKIVVVIALVASLFFSGINSRHLKDLVIVEGMAIDKKDEKINLVIQTLNVGISNGAQIPEGNMTINTEKEAQSIPMAIANMSKTLSKRVFFGQNKLIIVGRELAESNFSDYLDYFLRSADARADLAVCISTDKAKDVIESKENDVAVPCENMLYLIENNKKMGLSTSVTTNDLLNMYADKTTDMYLPVLEKSEKEDESVTTNGIGLFDDDKLVYITDDEETTGFVLLTTKVEDIAIEAEDEELGVIDVKLSNVKCKKSISVVNGDVFFNVKLKASMIIDDIENGVTSTIDENSMNKISSLIQNRIEYLCNKAFVACQQNNSDSLRIGELLAKDSPSSYELLSDDWKQYFSTVKMNIESDVKLKKISDNTQME